MQIEKYGIESVSEAWRQAWSLPMYQIPGSDYDEAQLRDLENPLQNAGLLRGSSIALIEVALMLQLQCGHEPRLAEIVRRVQAAQPSLHSALALVPEPIRDEAIEIRLHAELVTGLLEPRLPSREVLIEVAERFLTEQVGSRKIGALHPTDQARARLVAHTLVLADHFDLLSRILKQTTPAMINKSPHWMLYDALARHASQVPGRSLAAAIRSNSVAPMFRQMLQWHRSPVVQGALGSEGVIGGRPIIGNYLYTWCFVRLFATDIEPGLNWQTLRTLMTG